MEGLKSAAQVFGKERPALIPHANGQKHKMPILSLVPDAEVAKAKVAGAVNRAKVDEASIDKAMEYLHPQFLRSFGLPLIRLQRHNHKELCCHAHDIQEVKDYLDSHIVASLDWFGLWKLIKSQMVEAKYNQAVANALAKIMRWIYPMLRNINDLLRIIWSWAWR